MTVRDVTLRNVTIHGGLLSPGILICNETNPCTNMIFDNVNVYNMSHWPIKDGYLCESFNGYAINSNLVPSCFKKVNSIEEIEYSVSGSKINMIDLELDKRKIDNN